MNRTRQEIEALADIFVGGVPTPEEAPADRVVLLLEGHLPVRGALWRHSAATMVADESGQGGTLLEVDDRELHAVRFGGEPLRAATLEHIIAAPQVGHLWIVAGFGCGIGPDVSGLVSEIVLLTGADQAAVVGAYRTVKQLVNERAGVPLSVGVIIAGSSPAVSEEVWGRLSSTFHEHLEVQSRLIGILSRLDVAEPTDRISVPMPTEGLPLLLSTIRARPVGLAPPPVITEPPSESEPAIPPPAPPDSGDRLPEGLRLFEVHTPLPPGVQVAVDVDGGVHLVAAEAGCGSLESARGWAEQHLPLLAAADSGIRVDRPVSCDLLVEDYHRAGSLAGGPWNVFLVHLGGFLRVPKGPDTAI
ncbi:MAG: hypothetical protein QGI75_05395 [Phycisphaerales bacterium]|jgi:hypothetical protein|nr:hypothetical protein [Phycisphaerales bacterium]MDP6889777.1 hypothetical protein [Phycisphaerales bacterium]